MKYLSFINYSKIILLSSSLLFVSCKKEEKTTTTKEAEVKKSNSMSCSDQAQGSSVPGWVLDPRVPGKIAAVGIASPSKGGLKVQIPEAKAAALGDIATQIQSKVSTVAKSALQKAKSDNVEAYQEAFSQATKVVVTDVPTSGAVIINICRDEESSLYVHVVLDQDAVLQYLTQSTDIFSKYLASAGATKKVIQSVNDSMNPLFKELEFERKENNKTQGEKDIEGEKTAESSPAKQQ
jgi:hypothetical protein